MSLKPIGYDGFEYVSDLPTERAVKDAEYWAKEGLSTRIHCQRCGKWDSELNPACPNAILHERYTGERNERLRNSA
jgi:hypothetical protein